MPQTSADLEGRKKALSKLAEKFPDVAWPICIDQFSLHSRVGHYSHKPRWRPDGHGHGNVVTVGEGNDFALHAFNLALAWPHHTRSTVGDRSEEHTSELQSLMRISYAFFCLKKKNTQ